MARDGGRPRRIGRELNLPAARGWGIILLVLSVARLFLFDYTTRSVVVFSIGGLNMSQWMLMAWGAVLAHVIAWLRPGGPGRLRFFEQHFAPILGQSSPLFDRTQSSAVLDYAAAATRPAPCVDLAGSLVAILGTILFVGASATVYRGSTLTLLGILWLVPMIRWPAKTPRCFISSTQ